MNLRSMARALGGVVVGHEVLCPGPGHSPQDRSLSVKIDVNSPDLFIVHSFAKDDFRECRDYVKARLGIDDRLHARSVHGKASRRREGVEISTSSDPDRTARALAIWREARP